MKMTAFDRDKIKNIFKKRILKAYQVRVIDDIDIYKNTLDPFSAVLDAKLLNKDIQSWIDDIETPRQTQKSIQNILGEVHQEIIGTVNGWTDLGTGMIIDVENSSKKIIGEIKNKHNTTKGNHKKSIYDDLESALNNTYKDYTGYCVEILPKNGKTYNKLFTPPDNVTKKNRPENKKIRLIDGKSFYEMVTGEENALEQLYNEFPSLIDEILSEEHENYSPNSLGKMKDYIFEKVFPKE